MWSYPGVRHTGVRHLQGNGAPVALHRLSLCSVSDQTLDHYIGTSKTCVCVRVRVVEGYSLLRFLRFIRLNLNCAINEMPQGQLSVESAQNHNRTLKCRNRASAYTYTEQREVGGEPEILSDFPTPKKR